MSGSAQSLAIVTRALSRLAHFLSTDLIVGSWPCWSKFSRVSAFCCLWFDWPPCSRPGAQVRPRDAWLLPASWSWLGRELRGAPGGSWPGDPVESWKSLSESRPAWKASAEHPAV